MKATIEGLYTLKKDRPLGLQLIKRYLRVDDDMAGIGYDYYVVKHGDGILSLPDRRGLELVIEQVARENPKPEDRAQKAWDYWSRAFWMRSRGVGFSRDSNEDSLLTRLMSRLKNSIGQRNRMPIDRKASESQPCENGGTNR
jgi:hypothetical protein